jgi:hypothetical protein
MQTLAASGQDFTSDDLIDLVGPVDPGHEANARSNSIGSLFTTAKNMWLIEWTGKVVKSRQKHRKGGAVRVWRGRNIIEARAQEVLPAVQLSPPTKVIRRRSSTQQAKRPIYLERVKVPNILHSVSMEPAALPREEDNGTTLSDFERVTLRETSVLMVLYSVDELSESITEVLRALSALQEQTGYEDCDVTRTLRDARRALGRFNPPGT